MKQSGRKTIANNRRAYHDYFIDEVFEAGIELFGTEVKSVRAGTISIKEAWCQCKDGEIFVRQMNISPYEQGNIFNKDPLRPKRLLLHKREINYLSNKVQRAGCSLIPLEVYLQDSLVKIAVALCRGKKTYDKRDADAEKTAKKTIEREMKERNRRYE